MCGLVWLTIKMVTFELIFCITECCSCKCRTILIHPFQSFNCDLFEITIGMCLTSKRTHSTKLYVDEAKYVEDVPMSKKMFDPIGIFDFPTRNEVLCIPMLIQILLSSPHIICNMKVP